MPFAELALATAVAAVMTALLVFVFRRGTVRSRRIWVGFAVILLAAWAAGVWSGRLGPAAFALHWLAPPVVGALFAFVVAAIAAPAVSPPAETPRQEKLSEGIESEAAEATAGAAAGAFIWMLLLALILALIVGYIMP